MSDRPTVADIPRLALRRPDAAKAIGISERQLQDLGDTVPHFYLTERIPLYPVDGLREWLSRRLQEVGQE